MGAFSDLTEQTAHERASSDTGETEAVEESGDTESVPVDAPVDPFAFPYYTDLYEADSETVQEVLSGIIAVGNLL